MAAGVFNAITGFIRKFTEINLPGVRRQPQHEDVGAGAENTVFLTGQDNSANFRMFETNALQRVVQFDIDTQVIGIQFQFIPGTQTSIFVHVHRKGGHLAIKTEFPVLILTGIGAKIDGGSGFTHG